MDKGKVPAEAATSAGVGPRKDPDCRHSQEQASAIHVAPSKARLCSAARLLWQDSLRRAAEATDALSKTEGPETLSEDERATFLTVFERVYAVYDIAEFYGVFEDDDPEGAS